MVLSQEPFVKTVILWTCWF